ncbi:MAG: HD domain-containing protein [Dehalococcoidales bacterium]|nr:HD domain-containing protein [Dehalococcoidales bacterium]
MNRDETLKAVRTNVKNENLVRHMLATEAIMRALARRSGENEDEWGIAGLLHDIDLELIKDDMNVHSKHSAEMAKQLGASDAVCHAILCHNEAHGVPFAAMMDKALFCTDPLTGLITAGALVRPDKKLAGVEAKSIRKRFKEKSFAAGANREQIAKFSDIGLELDDFIALGLEAMKSAAGELGL